MYEVFTDGSCEPNPGIGSYGFVIIKNGVYLREFVRRESVETTNNRMEMKAIIEGVISLSNDSEIVVYSDSMLCVNTFNDWIDGWFKSGKITKKKNIDLINELFVIKSKYKKLSIKWVKGHSDNYWNNYVDELVNKAVYEL